MFSNVKKWLTVGTLVSALFCQPSMSMTFDKIIAFGDSLSDNGNLLTLTTLLNKVNSSIPIMPIDPYYQGRFTNGLVWVDLLSTAFNVPLTNHAYAGAWAESFKESGSLLPFGLGMQVNSYLASSALDFHKDKHLYVIWAGGNDYLNDRDNIEEATTKAVAAIKDQVDWLVYAGAKNFFILNLPDLGFVPFVTDKGPDYAARISALSRMHNQKLAVMIEALRTTYPKAKMVSFDVETAFGEMMADPEKYNFKNVTTACFIPDPKKTLIDPTQMNAAKEANLDITNNPSLKMGYMISRFTNPICTKPDEFLFWDPVHPTRTGHQVISALTYNTLVNA